MADDFIAPPCNDFFEILYQDDDILLINKPSGLLSLSGKNPLNQDSLHYRLVHGQKNVTAAFPQAILPHRLDLGTSGIMVVGLHADASKHLNKQFQMRKVKKHYSAMLDGWLGETQGEIIAPIAKDATLFPRVKICHQSGKQAVSEYTLLKQLSHPPRSLVQFTPQTGRTHQLRIHSQYIGHPILGCDLYSSNSSEPLADRLLLHASDIYFQHPATGQAFHGHSPCPFDE